MASVGGTLLGMATPQSVEIVAGVYRSCRVKTVSWANNQLCLQEKSGENRIDKTNDTARDASLC